MEYFLYLFPIQGHSAARKLAQDGLASAGRQERGVSVGKEATRQLRERKDMFWSGGENRVSPVLGKKTSEDVSLPPKQGQETSCLPFCLIFKLKIYFTGNLECEEGLAIKITAVRRNIYQAQSKLQVTNEDREE